MIWIVAVVVARVALAAGPCDEARDATGLGIVIRDGAVVVGEVTAGSAAATSGVKPGDAVLQVNGTVARSCAEWAQAVKEARGGAKALLLLVGRGETEVPLALGRRTWGGGATEPANVVTTPMARIWASPPAVPEPPAPLSSDVAVTVDSVLSDLGALLGRTREGLARYRDAVTGTRRAVETLAVRKAAPEATVVALRGVARLHETAVLAWEAMDAIRERDGISRRLPISEAATGPYFSGSPIQSALDEFEFLRETSVSEPSGGRFTESSGEWRPAAARRLAWEHSGEELGRVAAGLTTTP